MTRPIQRLAAVALGLAAWLTLLPGATLAHDAPDQGQAAWVMADWMLLSFLVFFTAAVIVFVVAYKRGLLTDLENAKYHILTIEEPDFYTPDWAKDEPDA